TYASAIRWPIHPRGGTLGQRESQLPDYRCWLSFPSVFKMRILDFTPCYDPGMSRLRWVPAAFMAVCLLSFLPLVVLPDSTMRLHIANLLRHSVARFLGSQGTTGLGFLTPFMVSGL